MRIGQLAEEPIEHVKGSRVRCDGGGGALGIQTLSGGKKAVSKFKPGSLPRAGCDLMKRAGHHVLAGQERCEDSGHMSLLERMRQGLGISIDGLQMCKQLSQDELSPPNRLR